MATLPSFPQRHSPTASEFAELTDKLRQSTNFVSSSQVGITPTISATTGATYYNINQSPVTFTKYGNSSTGVGGSDVFILVMASFYVSVAGTSVDLALKFTSTQQEFVAGLYVNVANTSHQAFGIWVATGYPAGTYQLYMTLLNASATGTVTMDNGNSASWFVMEVPH